LTEQLLGACVGGDAEFRRVGDRYVCRWTTSGETQEAPVPLPPAAFRTILARIAALCNERSPNSVSPYGGQGLLAVKGSPSTVFHVNFINTPNEQRLEVRGKAEVGERVDNATVVSQAIGIPPSLSTEEKAILLALVAESRGLGWGVAVYPFESEFERQGIDRIDAHIAVAALQRKGLVRLEERAAWDDLRDRASLYPVYCVTAEGFTAALQMRNRG
jgi:hypothetical protein